MSAHHYKFNSHRSTDSIFENAIDLLPQNFEIKPRTRAYKPKVRTEGFENRALDKSTKRAERIAKIEREQQLIEGLIKDNRICFADISDSVLGLKSVRTNSKKEYVKEKRKKNILKQQFKADSPNRVWVSDVTVFSYGDYYYYICAIIDLFSRKVVAYHISKYNSTQLVKTTMKRAITARNPSPGLIFHTDNGSNFCSKTFEDYLKENEVVHSFSRSGTPHDNAVAESFFS